MILLFGLYLFDQIFLFYINETNLGIFLENLELPLCLSSSNELHLKLSHLLLIVLLVLNAVLYNFEKRDKFK